MTNNCIMYLFSAQIKNILFISSTRCSSHSLNNPLQPFIPPRMYTKLNCIHYNTSNVRFTLNVQQYVLNNSQKPAVRWKRILLCDPIQCARYLYCELGAQPANNEVLRGFVYMLT